MKRFCIPNWSTKFEICQSKEAVLILQETDILEDVDRLSEEWKMLEPSVVTWKLRIKIVDARSGSVLFRSQRDF